jgi:hypothetical protein
MDEALVRNDGFPGAGTQTPTQPAVDSDGDGLWDSWDMAQRTDVNNDSLPDIVGFANAGTYVALNTGTTFQPASRWISSYGYDTGWRVEKHPRMLGGN